MTIGPALLPGFPQASLCYFQGGRPGTQVLIFFDPHPSLSVGSAIAKPLESSWHCDHRDLLDIMDVPGHHLLQLPLAILLYGAHGAVGPNARNALCPILDTLRYLIGCNLGQDPSSPPQTCS